MNLVSELKERRTAVSAEMDRLEEEGRGIDRQWKEQERLFDDLDTAIRALDPTDPPTAEEMFGNVTNEQSELFEAEKEAAREQLEREPEIPEGFTKWDGAHTPLGPGSFLQVMYRDGEVSGPYPSDEVFAYWEGDGCDDDVIAYRIVDAPSQSDPDEQDDASDFVSDLQGDSVPQMQQAFDEILAAQEERPALNEAMQDEREQLVDGYAPLTNPEADFWARGLTEQPKPEPFRFASIFRFTREDV